MQLTTPITESHAAASFVQDVKDFLSTSCAEAPPACAMLILSLAAYRHESGSTTLDPLRLIRLAYACSQPARQLPSKLDGLLAEWHWRRHVSPAWELYLAYRDTPPPVRHHSLALLSGGFWCEFFWPAAEETVLALEEEMDAAAYG